MKTIVLALILAHYAPSGWGYPWWCCSDHDCHIIDCNKITSTPDGWQYPHPLGFITFGDNSFRESPDDQCHGCWLSDPASVHAPVGRCLFMPKGMV